jgi:RHS repeat-associated protein
VEACNVAGLCEAEPPPVIDDDACTADACDPVLGVRHVRLPNCTVVPPDPAALAPPLDATVATDIAAATAFLYTGPTRIQYAVAAGAIDALRVAVLRGKVTDPQGVPLAGVRISAIGHPELGWTGTREDGAFDLAVNGGGSLTLSYELNGYPTAQRQVQAPWRDYARVDDVTLVPFDTAVTTVVLGASQMQVARGNPVTDVEGTRQATVFFPAGTQASMVLPSGATQSLSTMNVRATEYTVGNAGPKAMPGALPPASGYTYAVELSVDEAISAGATSVQFNQPIPFYVENFLGFPVGVAVPVGFYDRAQGAWMPLDDGKVIRVLDSTSGLADLDTNGDGIAEGSATLTALGVTVAERGQLAATYSPGTILWRVLVTHFSPFDCNWPYGCESADGCRSPDQPKPDPTWIDDPYCESGSIIECENQVLGETVPVVGTPFSLNYRSSRALGYAGTRTLNIHLTGSNVPSAVISIGVEVDIAGQTFSRDFAPAPNLVFAHKWDGLDAYGRAVQGGAVAHVSVLYRYRQVYLGSVSSSTAPARTFGGYAAAGASVIGVRDASVPVAFVQTFDVPIGSSMDYRGQGLGGWSLNVHHVYLPDGHVLLQGDGTTRTAADTIATFAGIGPSGFSGDGGPASAAMLNSPQGLAVGADGSLYIADYLGNRIRRVQPDGIITTVAGTAASGYSGDGGPATAAVLNSPSGIAVGPDGTVFIADTLNNRIRRVGPDGIITTVAGTGASGYSGDEGPAVAAKLYYPQGVAVGGDGTLFIGDGVNQRIRRVGRDGIITTVAGTGGTCGYSGDGGRATAARLCYAEGFAIGLGGALFFADYGNHRVRRVGPDGIITTVAGTGARGYSGDGGPAATAMLNYPEYVAIGKDGELFIADGDNQRVRRVGSSGIITTFAGNGTLGYGGDGGPATSAMFYHSAGVAVSPGGGLFVSDSWNGGAARIRVVRPALLRSSLGEFLLASADGAEVFVFSGGGRHLKTVDATTGALRYSFDYDASGRLASVTDSDGNLTQIQRDPDGRRMYILAPGGQATTLSIGDDGMLGAIANPAGEATAITYYSGGLLEYFTEPNNWVHHAFYDANGLLTKDDNPAGGYKRLARADADAGFSVAISTALGQMTDHLIQFPSLGGVRRVSTAPDGTQSVQVRSTSGSSTTTYADGTVSTVQLGPDPRFGMAAPVSSATIQTPAGRTRSVTESRTATLTNQADALSATALGEMITVNGRAHVATYDAATRTWTFRSPAGRTSTATLDANGKLVQVQPPSTPAISFDYEGATGRLWRVSNGPRIVTFDYHAEGTVRTITDPTLRTASFTYYPSGRVWTETLPGGRTVTFGYDAAGNLTTLTPPERPQHAFAYTPAEVTYTPPPAPGTGSLSTVYQYDLDGALADVGLPDSSRIVPTYFPAGQPSLVGRSGKLESLTTWRGTTWLDYDTSGRLSTVQGLDGGSLTFGYDGPLVAGETWGGAVAGSVGYAYDNDFRLSSSSVNSGNAVSYGYDSDGLLTQAGDLSTPRDAATGRISTTTLGVVTTTPTYDAYGTLDGVTATASGKAVYSYSLTKDLAGRITGKTETIGRTTTTYEYVPDNAGRLHQIKVNGAVAETYDYDANGNRLSKSSSAGTEIGLPDDQDRLLSYGSASYTYGASGDLQSKTVAGATTWYSYDPFGNLVWSQLPSGTQIDYVTDGLNRRIGKKVNGQLVEGFLYQGQLRPVAWLNGAGQVYATFVYGTRVNVPEYMVTASGTFRILTDHLGSPRLVVNSSTGAVVQRIDYDAYGNVLSDTAPGFQPFGFAGGLYDRDTGLVRFGVRDYDPSVGRWTNKDPIRFAGGLNLYEYAAGDPVSMSDPSGKLIPVAVTLIGGAFGAVTGLITGLAAGQSGGELLKTVGMGAVTGAMLSWLPVSGFFSGLAMGDPMKGRSERDSLVEAKRRTRNDPNDP